MFHSFVSDIEIRESEWWIFDIRFLSDISYQGYNKHVDVDLIFETVRNSGREIIQDMEIEIIEGALWDRDEFRSGERARAMIRIREGDERMLCCALFANSDKYHPVEKDRILRLLTLDSDLQMNAFYFSMGEGESSTSSYAPLFPTPLDLRKYYQAVKGSLSRDQRQVCESWLSINKNTEKKKLDYFLGISPNAPDLDKVRYEEIMAVLNEHIVGRAGIKKTLANERCRRLNRDKRGMVVLMHGLPGTGKTDFGMVFAKAIGRPYKRINMGSVSRTTYLIGSESEYSDCDAGIFVKTARRYGTSEIVFGLDEFGSIPGPGEISAADTNIAEVFLSLLDPAGRYLSDNFLEGADVDFNNAVFFLTTNRVDDIQPEFLNRIDLILEVTPTESTDLIEILKRRAKAIAEECDLSDGWIGEEVLTELIRYRGDFGARDALSYLEFLSGKVLEYPDPSNTCYEVEQLHDDLTEIVDLNDPGVIYHLNQDKYPEEQEKAILDAFSRKGSGSHLSEHDRLMIDKEIEYLTRLIPHSDYTFDPDVFLDEIRTSVYGMDEIAEEIASELYSSCVTDAKPTPIILHGPAGTGKTTLAEGIAKASGRPLLRIQCNGMSVMGVKGTYKQYRGADAGDIVKGMAKHMTSSPVVYLDELDKVSHEVAMAFLDLFDDSGKFFDNLLGGVSIDVRSCIFIASCNDLSRIDPILLSRFRVCNITGYSVDEKLKIAHSYIIPGVVGSQNINFDEGAVKTIVARHGTEAGIRGLKHDIYKIVKKTALNRRSISGTHQIVISENDVASMLGEAPFKYIASDRVGCVNGLAVMGDMGIVMPISVTLLKSDARRITGMPKEAILDSISVAETWMEGMGYTVSGMHVHFTPGGVPKDGPSAGLALAIAMYSAFTGRPISDAAFTGEFDGYSILPVGGIPLKVQAAADAGLRTVFIPAACSREAEKCNGIDIVPVADIDEVIRYFECTRGQ